MAILTGDFLFARASDILADLGPEAYGPGAHLRAAGPRSDPRDGRADEGADPVEHYLPSLADKTGSLIATSCRFGAMLAGADERVEMLTRYGERIGVAFQLSDDLLDVVSETTESGKTPGTDLREGVPTLPVLLRRADDPADQRLRQLLGGRLRRRRAARRGTRRCSGSTPPWSPPGPSRRFAADAGPAAPAADIPAQGRRSSPCATRSSRAPAERSPTG